MIDFIVKLEMALDTAGIEYELKYLPDERVYVLGIDGTEVFLMSVKEEDENDQT